VTEATRTINELMTTYERVRCVDPSRVERMKRSLATHGQLTPAVVAPRKGVLELLDGFKRRRAAMDLGWTTLRVVVTDVEEPHHWAMLLLLNREPQSLSILEEALVLREMTSAGLSQAQIGELLQRHKSWVSRRVGLVERLHPELVAEIREGILTAGAARRLLSLPPGNQLQLAAVVKQSDLSPSQTESLVTLWRRAERPEVRDYLLKEPREALANARAGNLQDPVDPRLSPRGLRLQQSLRILHAVAHKTKTALRTPLLETERAILATDLELAEAALSRLLPALGSARPVET
jgi:ParB/RepB/Spo0J family partition protein